MIRQIIAISLSAFALLPCSVTAQEPVRGAAIVGIVRDTADHPLYGAWFIATAIDSSHRTPRRGYTDPSGRFRLTGMVNSRYQIELGMLGYYRLVDTVDATPDQQDTVSFRLRQMPHPSTRAQDLELLSDSLQPSLSVTKNWVERCGQPVDSIYVLRDGLVLTGYRSKPTTGNEYEVRLYRSAAGLVLELQDVFVAEVGMAVTCSRWRGSIGNLRLARYYVTVRASGDPSIGPAHARVLWAGKLNLRTPSRFAVDSTGVP